MKIALPLIIFLFSMPMTTYEDPSLPKGFVYIKEVIPDVVLDVRYAGNDNFIGKPITGYKEPKVILSRPAAAALQKVQKDLKTMGYCLKIFDGYRPQRAVNHFIAWAKVPGDTLMKRKYYPEVDKKNLFNLGYISTRSGHSRGSTVDLTIIDMNTQEEVDMGGAYDFFGDRSHHNYSGITAKQKANRAILKNVMIKHGFKPYTQEWWHYTYQPEPYPNTYFDFEVM